MTWEAQVQISALFAHNRPGIGKGKNAQVLWGSDVLEEFLKSIRK